MIREGGGEGKMIREGGGEGGGRVFSFSLPFCEMAKQNVHLAHAQLMGWASYWGLDV